MPLLGNTARGDEQCGYHFKTYDQNEKWAIRPEYMVDGWENNYSSTPFDGDVELLTENTCREDEGPDITKVEIQVKGYYTQSGSCDIIIRPVYGGTDDGIEHVFDAPKDPPGEWSEWFDITDELPGHVPWSWEDVRDLDCDIESDGSGYFAVYCSYVRLRVTVDV